MNRRFTHRRLVAAAAGLLVLTTTFITSSASGADFFFGPYNIDGEVPGADATPPPVGQNLPDLSGNVKEVGPKNSNTTKIGVIHNAGVPMLADTNPNGQVDLRQAWLNFKRVDGADWLYFAWERDANSGSGFIAYEFMKKAAPASCTYAAGSDLTGGCNPWANRSAGDFLLLWDQSGNDAVFYKRVWSGSGASLTLGPPVLLDALTEAFGVYSPDGFRGEASVNLTEAGLTTGNGCVTIANVIPGTVTGNSDSADYKDTILRRITPLSTCTGTLTTTPKDGDGVTIDGGGLSIGTGGVVAVKDQAVIAVTGGAPTPTGTVTFWLCKVDSPALCTGGTQIGSPVAVSGASYPVSVLSPTAWVTSAGRYCWRSTWSGDSDSNLPALSENSASECFTVTPVTPTLSTQASADTPLGSPVSDTATLGGTAKHPMDPAIRTSLPAGGAPAGGTIVFTLYGPSDSGCGPLVHTTAAVPVSGDGSYPSPSFTPTAAGTYHWVATYSGSSPNTVGTTHNGDCTDSNEDVEVQTVPSTMSTVQSWIPNDSATISAPAGGVLAGTVTFTLYSGTWTGACGPGTQLYTTTRPVAGASPQTVATSNTTPFTTTGTTSYWWKVSYDSTNPAQRDIPDSCHETSTVTVANGSPVSSP